MKYHELSLKPHKRAKRVGRGISGGQGKTAGRGTKGQGSRAGSTRRPGFAGGQNPLMQRLPKLPGFRSLRAKAELIYTDQLIALNKKNVDNSILASNGLTSSEYVSVKLLSRGDIGKPVDIKIQAASKSAIDKIQKAGGSVQVVPQVKRPAKASQN